MPILGVFSGYNFGSEIDLKTLPLSLLQRQIACKFEKQTFNSTAAKVKFIQCYCFHF